MCIRDRQCIIVIDIWFSIGLPNSVKIGQPKTESWRHIDFFQDGDHGIANTMSKSICRPNFGEMCQFAAHILLLQCYYCGGLAYSGSSPVSINEVTLRRARLVLGWVTGPGFNSRCRKPIAVYNHPSRSTQPGRVDRGKQHSIKSQKSVIFHLLREKRTEPICTAPRFACVLFST